MCQDCVPLGCQCSKCAKMTSFCCCRDEHEDVQCPDDREYNRFYVCPDFTPKEENEHAPD